MLVIAGEKTLAVFVLYDKTTRGVILESYYGFLYVLSNGELKASEIDKTVFQIRGNRLVCELGTLFWTEHFGKEYIYASNDPDTSARNFVRVEQDFYDVPCTAKGSYATIYSPSLINGVGYVTRVSHTPDFYPNLSLIDRDELKYYFLLPGRTLKTNHYRAEEYVLCDDAPKIRTKLRSMKDDGLMFLLSSFRNLYLGLIAAEKRNILNLDISASNVVMTIPKSASETSVFKFIDLDFLIKNKRENANYTLFTKNQMVIILPTILNCISMMTISNIKLDDIVDYDSIQLRRRMNYYKTNVFSEKVFQCIAKAYGCLSEGDVLYFVTDYLESMTDAEKEKLYYFSQIYNTTLILSMYLSFVDCKNHRSILEETIIDILNYEENDAITATETLEKYDMMISKIKEREDLLVFSAMTQDSTEIEEIDSDQSNLDDIISCKRKYNSEINNVSQKRVRIQV